MVSPDLTQGAILVICGATGSGKGGLAREVAAMVDGEIICADSRKIYRGFDIGTAKAGPGHLVDVCDPREVFCAGRYMELADLAIADIQARGKVPIVAGGTGLYLRTLLHGIVEAPARDENLRTELLSEESSRPGILHQRLTSIDPDSAAQIPPGDLVRTVRALEVHRLTGRRISEMQSDHRFQPVRYHALQVAPDWPRADLYERINTRVDRMMAAGWLDEVRTLRAEGFVDSPAFQSVGYRQLNEVLDGTRTLDEAVDSIKTEHRRYARRQLVWFRGVKEIRWLPTPLDAEKLVADYRKFQPTRK